MRISSLLALGLTAAALVPGAAAQAQGVGTAVAVSPEATVTGAEGTRALRAGGEVRRGETVETGAGGEVQILFEDETRIVVGPGARLVIEDVLFRSSGAAERFVVGAARGSFRFISGTSDREAVELRTPVGTIGIRGTGFDFTVNGTAGLDVALLDGEVRICAANSRRCAIVLGDCALVSADTRGRFTVPETATAARALLASGFPFISGQDRLRRDFRLDADACASGPVPLLRIASPSAGPAAPPAAPAAAETGPEEAILSPDYWDFLRDPGEGEGDGGGDGGSGSVYDSGSDYDSGSGYGSGGDYNDEVGGGPFPT